MEKEFSFKGLADVNDLMSPPRQKRKISAERKSREEDSWIAISLHPDTTGTLDGIGRPSPLWPEENYLGVRKLNQDEVLKCEKNKPPLPTQNDDILEEFRAADSLHTTPVIYQKASVTAQKGSSQGKLLPMPHDNSCMSIQEDRRLHEKGLVKKSQKHRKSHSKRFWRERLPPDMHSLPIYALKVRWPSGHRGWTHTLEMVYVLLSRFGPVVSFGQLSPNSAVAVFQDVKTAAQVVACCQSSANSRLLCSWWFMEMASYDTMMKERISREIPKPYKQDDEMTVLKKRFKLLQTKVAEQIRKRKSRVAYDMLKFIP